MPNLHRTGFWLAGEIRFHRHPYLRLGEARAAAAAIGTRDPLQNALPRAAVVWAVCTPTLAVCALPPSLSSNPKYTKNTLPQGNRALHGLNPNSNLYT